MKIRGSNVKPRKPLKRTALKPPTLEAVQKWQNKPRKPIGRNAMPARVGRKAKREEASWQQCRAKVIERSKGCCEGAVEGVCPPWKHGAQHVHHIEPNDRDRGLHDPRRCLHLCGVSHSWTHANPRQAKVLGLLRPDPVVVPDEPLWPEVVC